MCSHPRVQNTAISPEGTASHTGTAEWLSYTGGQTFVPVRWWEVSNSAESAVPFRNFKCCNLFSFHLPISSPFHYRNIRHPLCLFFIITRDTTPFGLLAYNLYFCATTSLTIGWNFPVPNQIYFTTKRKYVSKLHK